MTEAEKIERLWEDTLQVEKTLTSNSKAIESLNHRFNKLQHEWKIYENRYIEYLAKRDRFRNSLWWLWRKITFRSTKVAKDELTKRVARKMARVFYKRGR